MGRSTLLPIAVAVIASLVYYYCTLDRFDPASIRDKRVLITGASSGIGEQLAYQYARLGAKIVITARRQKLLETVVRKCKDLGATAVESVAADMAVAKDRSRVVAEAEKILGGLDHLILNHAIFDMHWWTGAPENMTTLQNYLDINFLSFVDLTSKALPMLMASKGNIGVVSSVAGKFGNKKFAPYVSTKFALQGFYSSFRQEMLYKETGVSVTLCVLGFIDTEKAVELIGRHHPDQDTKSMAASAEDTALVILKGVTNRLYEVYYPKLATIFVTLHKMCPETLEWFLASQN